MKIWRSEKEANTAMNNMKIDVEEAYNQLARLEASTQILPMRAVKIRKQKDRWKKAIEEYEYYWEEYKDLGFSGHPYQQGMPFEYLEEEKQMKITRRQLRRIIKEEKAKIQEAALSGTDMMKMQIVDEIIDVLIDRGTVQRGGLGSYIEAYEYLETAILPTLKSIIDDDA